MEIFPDLEVGLFNGWLLAAILYLVFGIVLVLVPKRVVARLYDRSSRRDNGAVRFVVALFDYANTPADQPATAGLYRISRHPQQFMISVSFLGISIAIGSWTALILMGIAIIVAHSKVLAEEEACLQLYGESYQDYMERIPRYFLLF